MTSIAAIEHHRDLDAMRALRATATNHGMVEDDAARLV
jgi:hypothetical protein